MKTLENKIAKFLFDEGYETWDLMSEYEAGACEFLYIDGDRVLAEIKTDDGWTLSCRNFSDTEFFRPTEEQVKIIQDYLYGLTGYPELR